MRRPARLHREEFVVVGWTDPEGRRPWLGALLLAYYDPDGRLVSPTLPLRRRVRAPAREAARKIKGRGRRTRSKRWSIDRLIPYAKNARTHSDAQIAAIAASIKDGRRVAGERGHVRVQHAHGARIRRDAPHHDASDWNASSSSS
jgi:hypothetical protein